jgi:HpcH/HpaI aldolase/citrate lyase family
MLGYLGFDWILLDNEHGSVTVDTVEGCVAVAELSGMAPIVRPVGNRPEIIAPFLDRGAWGVQVPHVNTADEARAVVEAVKYAPDGHRGIFERGPPGPVRLFRYHRGLRQRGRLPDPGVSHAVGLQSADESIDVDVSGANGAEVDNSRFMILREVRRSDSFLMDIHPDVKRARLVHG